jgi:tRNA pseudouridine55 synthase
MYSGILNINKPTGWTSHDVVAKVRRILGQRAVGHAGTLDPLATGVLLVCVGQATRVSEYLMESDKTYRAVVRLGVATDTYDAEGQPTAARPLPAGLDTAALQAALVPFVGDILQIPPAYSALKQDGVPLHKLARRGKAVELHARPVSIHRIDVLAWCAPDLTIEVTCGSGTYIRSLAHDLGQALGCGAHLAALTRIRSGRFTIDDAISPEALAQAAEAGELAARLHPLSEALAHLTAVPVDEAAIVRLRHGQTLPAEAPPTSAHGDRAGLGYALATDGRVIAILRYNEGQWRPYKVFAESE